MSKSLKYILVLLLLLAVALEMVLPTVVSHLVAQGMVKVTQSDNVTATLEKRPAFLMLGGSFDGVQLAACNVKTGRIAFHEMQVNLQQVQLNMGKLISQRQVEFQKLGDIQVRAVITQEEIARYLNQSVKGVKNAQVTITPEKVRAASGFSLGGFMNVNIGLEGHIAGDGQRIKFVTERFFVNNLQTGSISGATLTEIPLVDLNKLPFQVGVRSIVLEEGRVILHLDNRQTL